MVLPVRGSRAFPRQSRTGLRHFVHRAGRGCCADHPGETPQHLAAKTVIVRAALRAGWDAVPEHQGPGWVADVLASSRGRRVALEVQWSRQTGQRYRERPQAYQDSDVWAVWFVRHEESVPPADPGLPVFQINRPENRPENRLKGQLEGQLPDHLEGLVGDGARGIGDGVGGFSVRVGQQQLPLGEVVVALLTGRVQFRELVGSGPSELVMAL